MNLLPKSHHEFSQKDYWNTFFSKRGKKAFEWYGEYPELCEHLHKYIKTKDILLIIGCGNSNLSMDLYDVGYKNITNIDISKVVIRQMQEINSKNRLDMKYLQMDATNTTFNNEEFSVVLDKGTLDALMPNDNKDTLQLINKLFNEIGRVLKVGGRYICISLLQEHILKQMLEYFPKNNWMFRIIRCHEAEKKTAEKGENTMPVFVVVCTKFNKLPTLILETCMAGEKMQRHHILEEVISTISFVQQAAFVCSGLNQNNIADQDEVSFDLFNPGESEPRYTIYIIDQLHQRQNGQYAVFIVPQGRETEWLFSTREGRKKLLKSAKFNRLAVVTMHRGQKYTDLESIKQELNSMVQNLAPRNITNAIPYLSRGDDVGKREIRYEGKSELSGPFVVEDVVGEDGQVFRRLVFLKNQNVVQSEAKMKNVKTRGGKRKLQPDPGYLACQHHAYMSIGVQMACTKQKQTGVIIGLGGGGLCTFLNHCLPEMNIMAVEIDAAMLKVATDYFNLKQNDKLTVHIEDGLKFIENAANNNTKYGAILFDVDSKDPSLGMSCPPREFLDIKVLENISKCINNGGIFILNLVLRDESLHDTIINKLKSNFKSVICYKLEEDLNEIVFCTNLKSNNHEHSTHEIKSAAEQLNNKAKVNKSQNDELVDVDRLMKLIKLY